MLGLPLAPALRSAPPGWPWGSGSDPATGKRQARRRTHPCDGFVLRLSQEQRFLCRSTSESAQWSRAAPAELQRVPAGLRWLSGAPSSPKRHLSPSCLAGSIPAASLPAGHGPPRVLPHRRPHARVHGCGFGTGRLLLHPLPLPRSSLSPAGSFSWAIFFYFILFQVPSCAEADVPARTSCDLG